jgi:uncharacterized protein YbcI
MKATAVDTARQARDISNGISHNHRKHFGRGPTSVRTSIHNDYVITYLEGIYTPIERTLIEGGKQNILMDARLAYQELMREEFITIVEQNTGRKVRAFMSQNHVSPDIAAELFFLEPSVDDTTDLALTNGRPSAK